MGKIAWFKVYVAVGGTVIEGMTSTSFDEVVEAIEATTQDSNGKKEYIGGDYDADMSIEGRFDSSHTYGETQLRTALNAKALVTVTWGDGLDTAGEQVLSASMLPISLSTSVAQGGTKNWACGFKVSGGTTESTSSTTIT